MERKSTILQTLIVLLPLSLVAFVVQWSSPQWQVTEFPAVMDDLDHLSDIAKMERGDLTLSEFLLTPHGPHWIPLWKTWYYLQWKLSRLSAWQWHLSITLHHVLSAVFLYFLLKMYFQSSWASFVSSILWAAIGIGGWDSPFTWVASSHFSMSLTWLLAAMICVPNICGGHRLRWGILLAFFLVLSLAMMGSMVMVAAALPLQHWLLSRDQPTSRSDKLVFFTCWSVPVLSVAMIQVLSASGTAGAEAARTASLVRPIVLSIGQFIIALGNLFIIPLFAPPQTEVSGLSFLVVLLVAGSLLTLRSRRRDVVALFLVLAAILTLTACFGRSHVRENMVLSWGRYHLLPTLFWCVAVGALLDRPLSGGRPYFLTASLCLAAILPIYVFRQTQIVRLTHYQHADEVQMMATRLQLMRFVAAYSQQNGRTARIPDNKVFREYPIYLSQYYMLATGGELAGLEFVDPKELTQEDTVWLQRAVNAMRSQTMLAQ